MEKHRHARDMRIAQMLGMGKGAAYHKMVRAILFHLAGQLGRTVCFRCSTPILTIKEFSIEHKLEWENSPDALALFFDMENIAFSHARCNSAAAKRVKKHFDSKSINRSQYERLRARPEAYAKKQASRKALRHQRSAARKLALAAGIEPAFSASKAAVLPLDEARSD